MHFYCEKYAYDQETGPCRGFIDQLGLRGKAVAVLGKTIGALAPHRLGGNNG